MEDKYILLKLKDLYNYLDYNEETIICEYLLKKDRKFEKNYNKLINLLKSKYESFETIIDFIEKNFIIVQFDEREIEI